MFYDTALLLIAGFDTTSHAICSTLYYLHKFPQTLSKLKDTLDKGGITNIDAKKEDTLKDFYEQWDYLAYNFKYFNFIYSKNINILIKKTLKIFIFKVNK